MTNHQHEELEWSVLGQTIRGQAFGSKDGIPVLALHGWLDNSQSFLPLSEYLDSRIRLVAVDLPGHGRSDHRFAGAVYGFADWAAPVMGVVQALGWNKFFLLGHSMGAGIAALLSGSFPKRVRGLALIEGFGPMTTAPVQAPTQMARHVMSRLAAKQESNARVFANRDDAAKRLQEGVSGLTLASAKLLVERGTKTVSGGVTWSTDSRLRTPSVLRFTEPHVLAFLKAIEAPTLLVQGTAGMKFPEEFYLPRRECVANLETVDLEGGHHVHMEHACDVAKIINRFLNPHLSPS